MKTAALALWLCGCAGSFDAPAGVSETPGSTAAAGNRDDVPVTTPSSAGATGSTGATGKSGPRGHTGANGTSGSSGPTGTSGVVSASGPAGVSGATGQWVMAYHMGYQFSDLPVAAIDWSGLTHIIFGAVLVNANHTLDLSFFADSAGAGNATAIADAAHAHGVKAILMLGGAGAGNIHTAITSDAAGFAQSLLSAMSTLHYDGLDLDLEDPVYTTPTESVADGLVLAKALRTAAPGVILTYPGGSIEYAQTVDPNIVKLATYLDRYNTQSYYGGANGLFTGTDYTGAMFQSWFGSALSGASDLTPYAIDYSLHALAAAGVPAHKLGMGVAFYATCYMTPATTPPGGSDVSAPRMPAYNSGSYCWDCGTGGGDNLFPLSVFFASDGRLAATSAGEQKRDGEAAEPYLGLSTAVNESHCGGNTKYILYEDETSLIAKGSFSKSNGYGGIIIWTLSEGVLPSNAAGGRSANALTQALKQGFLDP